MNFELTAAVLLLIAIIAWIAANDINTPKYP